MLFFDLQHGKFIFIFEINFMLIYTVLASPVFSSVTLSGHLSANPRLESVLHLYFPDMYWTVNLQFVSNFTLHKLLLVRTQLLHNGRKEGNYIYWTLSSKFAHVKTYPQWSQEWKKCLHLINIQINSATESTFPNYK